MIPFPCPSCHTTLKAPQSKAGTWARCPKCRGRVQVPVLPVLPLAIALCPFCAEQVLAADRNCRFCGEMLDPRVQPAGNPAVAFVMGTLATFCVSAVAACAVTGTLSVPGLLVLMAVAALAALLFWRV